MENHEFSLKLLIFPMLQISVLGCYVKTVTKLFSLLIIQLSV